MFSDTAERISSICNSKISRDSDPSSKLSTNTISTNPPTADRLALGYLQDELSGVERKVLQVERVTLPIAESVTRLAAQAQAQPVACSRPGSRARPAGNVAGNDENRPPMRFGLGPR